MADILTLQPPPVIPDGHKACPACHQIKSIDAFGKSKAMPDGVQFYCRECNRASIAEWRKKNPDKERANQQRYYRKHKVVYAERRKLWRRGRVARLVAMLKAAPCMDCHQSYAPCVMDFDHRPGEDKSFELKTPNMVHFKMETIMTEIAKCDLVCANCHRLRTRRRRMGEV
jgi:hypothetical protein